MATATGFIGARRGSLLRISALFVLVCSLMTIGTGKARARGYEWCSVDPVLSLEREGSLLPQLVDVQVMVPLSALPIAQTATLTVQLPSDVQGIELVNGSTPIFKVETVFLSRKAKATSDRFPVDLTLEVPVAEEAFPVQLVVTDGGSGTVTIVEGVAGKEVQTSFEVAP